MKKYTLEMNYLCLLGVNTVQKFFKNSIKGINEKKLQSQLPTGKNETV
jgi:hypothetical protein